MKTSLRSRSASAIAVLLFTLIPLASVSAGEDPWRFLDGFELIPDSPALIEEHYVAALFVSRDQGQLAVVIFNATCDPGNCEIHRRSAYSIFDRDGVNVRRYIDPGEKELLRLISDQRGA
ncbi:MAG: hypothetical protein ACREQP_13065 [Candidatus Binatia bacterium]